MTRQLAVLVLGVLLTVGLAGPATAGTRDDPEFTDPQDNEGADAVDVLAGWIQLTGDDLEASVEVADLGTGPPPGTQNVYEWRLLVGATEYRARATVEFGVSEPSADYALLDASGERLASLAGEYREGDDVVTWRIPRALVGAEAGTSIENTHATASMTGSAGQARSDRAPDQGFGASYALPSTDGGTGGPGNGGGPQAPAPTGDGAAIAAGVVVIALAGGVGAYMLRGRGGRLRLRCDAPDQTTRPGQGTNFPLRVVNDGGEPLTVHVEARDVPEGWLAFVPLPTLQVEGGETKELWVTIKPPEDAKTGDRVEVTVHAEAEERPQSDEVSMRAEVEAPAPKTAL